MRLHRQSGLRASIFVVAAGLFAGFFALVRAHPHLGAAEAVDATPPATDNRYERFFAGQPLPDRPAQPVAAMPTHSRTRAS